jgi:crotonobetainyl-CoA:carnitine CoA-transferase CaiB-like acyl-CoA transferase
MPEPMLPGRGPGQAGRLVVELCHGDVAGSYCGLVFSQLGYRVVKVEPPGGDPLRVAGPWIAAGRSARHEYLDAGKQSVELDVSCPEDAALRASLLSSADCVIFSAQGDTEAVNAEQMAVAARQPSLVRVVTSPFGLTGPYRNLPQTDITDWAASGYLYINGEPDREPLMGGGPFPAYTAGLTATIGALAVLRQVRNGGVGRLVDVSTFEAMAALHQWTITQYTYTGWIKRRAGNRHAETHHPVAFLDCADGWICIAAAGSVQWERLADLVGKPELVTDPRFQTSGERYDHADEVDELLAPWLQARTAATAALEVQQARVPAGVVYELHQVLSDEHLRSRGFLHEVEIDGRPLVTAGPAVVLGKHYQPSTAPALDADGSAIRAEFAPAATPSPPARPGRPAPGRPVPTDPLADVRVLDLTRAWAGPLAGRFLADLGAEVIHVEYSTARGAGVAGPNGFPEGVDEEWSWGDLPEASIRAGIFADADPGDEPWNRQASFNKLNRGKKSLCLDLHDPEGSETFRRLVAESDVVLENYSPRGAIGLGVVFDLLREVNPRIVVVSVSGYGHTGPSCDRVALGPIIEAESGLAALTGHRRGGPTKLGAAMPDAIAGLNGAIAIIAALEERDATGEGQYVDISMLESFVAIGGEYLLATSAAGRAPSRRGNRSADWSPQGVYRCSGEDEWIGVAVRTTSEWHRLVDLVGAPPLTDPRFVDLSVRIREQPYIDRLVGAWTQTRSKWEAGQALRTSGIAAMPVLTNADLVHDPHLNERGFITEWEQPGVGTRLYPGRPIRFDPPLADPLRPSAPLGADNRSILRDLLGYSEARIDALAERGVLVERPEGE